MNILLIIPENTGTIASVSYNLYKALKSTPNSIYVACLGQYSEYGYKFGDVYLFRQNKIAKIFDRIIGLRRLKKKLNVNLAISTLLGCNYWNVLSGIGEKKIGVFHTKLIQRKESTGMLNYISHYLCVKTICTRLDKAIAVNYSTYKDLQNLFHSHVKVDLAYNIHDFDRIKNLSLEPIEDIAEQKIFENNVILYVGGLYQNIKGTDRLLNAFSMLNDRSLNLVFIGGDGEGSLYNLRKKAVDYGVADHVFFLGYRENPYKYMHSAGVLVSPSRSEGLPGVLIEALSLGLKCVATNSSAGVWEIMECAASYDPYLNYNYKARYGFITPNKLNDEKFTEKKLYEAIEASLSSDFPEMPRFNISRFSADTVLGHYLEWTKS